MPASLRSYWGGPAFPAAPEGTPHRKPMATISSPHAAPLLDGRQAYEEPINALTHGLGLVFSLVAAWALCTTVAHSGDPLRIAGCYVYAAALVAVYLFSTLSHAFVCPIRRCRYRALDQAFIYFLIVGTYTPIALVFLRGNLHTALLVGMWLVATIGFLSKTVWRHRIDSISTLSYLVLGWLPVVAIPSALLTMPGSAISLIVAGGLCYTIGVAFLLLDRRVPYFHAVWHLLVMAGSALHFTAILNHVAVMA